MVSEKYQDLNVNNSINAKAIGADLLAAIKQAIKQEVFDIEHPIGDVQVQRPGEQTPAEKYGMGTWTLDASHNGRTEIGADGNYPLGSTGGEAEHSLTAQENGPHSHSLMRGLSYGTRGSFDGSLQYIGEDNFYNSGNTVQVQSSGSGKAFSLMQPYIAVNYWKRIA